MLAKIIFLKWQFFILLWWQIQIQDQNSNYSIKMGYKIVLEVLKLLEFSCNKYKIANCKFSKVTFFKILFHDMIYTSFLLYEKYFWFFGNEKWWFYTHLMFLASEAPTLWICKEIKNTLSLVYNHLMRHLILTISLMQWNEG